MKRLLIVLAMATLAMAMAFGEGKSEKLAEIEGTIVGITQDGDRAMVALRTDAGEEIVVEVPAGEVVRLRLRTEARVKVEGDYIGVPAAQKAQVRARVLARAVNVGGERLAVSEPLKLTTQDKAQIRQYEREQAQAGTQDRARTQDQSRTKTQEKSGR